jgi:hypothetical protein
VRPAVAGKVADIAPAGIVTEVGTRTRLLLEDNATVVPPAGAAPFSVITQLVVPLERRDVGLHVNEPSAADATAAGATVRVAV